MDLKQLLLGAAGIVRATADDVVDKGGELIGAAAGHLDVLAETLAQMAEQLGGDQDLAAKFSEAVKGFYGDEEEAGTEEKRDYIYDSVVDDIKKQSKVYPEDVMDTLREFVSGLSGAVLEDIYSTWQVYNSRKNK